MFNIRLGLGVYLVWWGEGEGRQKVFSNCFLFYVTIRDRDGAIPCPDQTAHAARFRELEKIKVGVGGGRDII